LRKETDAVYTGICEESTEILATAAMFHNSIHVYDTNQQTIANLVDTILAEELAGS
jgi:hypothetical protein